MNYELAYKILFNHITDAVAELENSKVFCAETANALDILKKAQQATEDMYVGSETDNEPDA